MSVLLPRDPSAAIIPTIIIHQYKLGSQSQTANLLFGSATKKDVFIFCDILAFLAAKQAQRAYKRLSPTPVVNLFITPIGRERKQMPAMPTEWTPLTPKSITVQRIRVGITEPVPSSYGKDLNSHCVTNTLQLPSFSPRSTYFF